MTRTVSSLVRKGVSSARAKRLLRAGTGVLGVALAALLVHAIAVTVFIRSGGLASAIVDAADEVAELRLEGGYSPFPGKVVADRFLMRLEDDSVQLELDINAFEVSVDLLALLKREFRASELRGDARFLFIKKVANPKGHEARFSAFPKIDGLTHPPVRKTPPEPGDEDPDTWVVDVQDVDLMARELWVQEFRYTGKARVQGDFLLRPKRRFRVSDARVTYDAGTLGVGKSPIVESLRGTSRGHIEEHDPDGTDVNILDHLTLDVDLEARGLDVTRPLRLYPSVAGYGIRTTDANLAIDAVVANAKIGPDSRVTLDAAAASMAMGPIRFDGPLHMEARAGRGGAVDVDATSPKLELSSPKSKKAEGPRLEGARAQASLNARRVDAGWSLERARVSLERMVASDLEWLNGPLGSRRFSAGSARGNLDVTRQASGTLEGSLELGVTKARVKVSDVTLIVSGTVEVDEPAKPSENGYALGRLSVRIDEVALADDPEERWWLAAVSSDATLRSQGDFKATFDIGGQSIEPLLPLLIESSILRTTAKGLLDLDETRATLSVDRSRSRSQLRVERFESGDLSARGLLIDVDGVTCGAFLVKTPYADVGVHVHPKKGVSVSPFSGSDWLEARMKRPCRLID